jgi:hypothetical protein
MFHPTIVCGSIYSFESTKWYTNKHSRTLEAKLLVDDVRILLVLLSRYPHLAHGSILKKEENKRAHNTFLKALSPARIEPPIHVEYLRSGGA